MTSGDEPFQIPLTEKECSACGAKFKVFLVEELMFCSLECRALGPLPDDKKIVLLNQDRAKNWIFGTKWQG